MKTKLFLAVCIFMPVLFSCNHAANKEQVKSENFELSDVKQHAPPESKLSANGITGNTQEPIPVGNTQPSFTTDSTPVKQPVKTAPVNPDWDKKIIKTADLKIEVKDFKSYTDKVHQAVKQFGGYIAQEEQHLSDDKSENVISIKVPVAQFEDMMNQLPGGDVKVLERKITSEDVTGEVVDTRSRLEAKKQMRLKYLDFLKQSKNMEEVLQVQNEINGIQEEIESASGRVGYLTHQSAFSTINLTFFQPMAGYKPEPEAPSFGTRMFAAFRSGAGWVAELFVGLISIWPLLLVIAGVVVIARKARLPKKDAVA